MLKKLKRIKRKHFIMMACAKLAFYAAVALFAKNQFDEMGNNPEDLNNTVQETTNTVFAKQIEGNKKVDYKLSANILAKENTKQ